MLNFRLDTQKVAQGDPLKESLQANAARIKVKKLPLA